MDFNNNRNLTMLLDFYELTMGNGFMKEGVQARRAVFDMFFRKGPDRAGFAIAAGLEQLVDYLKNDPSSVIRGKSSPEVELEQK